MGWRVVDIGGWLRLQRNVLTLRHHSDEPRHAGVAVITRRGLLQGVLAAATGPAIVRASSLDKLWLPPKRIIIPELVAPIGYTASGLPVGRVVEVLMDGHIELGDGYLSIVQRGKIVGRRLR